MAVSGQLVAQVRHGDCATKWKRGFPDASAFIVPNRRGLLRPPSEYPVNRPGHSNGQALGGEGWKFCFHLRHAERYKSEKIAQAPACLWDRRSEPQR